MMPIRDKSLYPADWKAISKRIRFERAGGRCEFCGVENGALIIRKTSNSEEYVTVEDSEAYYKELHNNGADYDDKIIKVVLTVAHLDHNPANCDDDNLRALCQRCHNRYDRTFRNGNAAATRARKKADAVKRVGQLLMWGDE